MQILVTREIAAFGAGAQLVAQGDKPALYLTIEIYRNKQAHNRHSIFDLIFQVYHKSGRFCYTKCEKLGFHLIREAPAFNSLLHIIVELSF
jgi:hypothetical protein